MEGRVTPAYRVVPVASVKSRTRRKTSIVMGGLALSDASGKRGEEQPAKAVQPIDGVQRLPVRKVGEEFEMGSAVGAPFVVEGFRQGLIRAFGGGKGVRQVRQNHRGERDGNREQPEGMISSWVVAYRVGTED